MCIKKFKDSTKVVSKRSVTFGGCHYAFAVSLITSSSFYFSCNVVSSTEVVSSSLIFVRSW
uniref:Uncharacterized protein n=1 Tax=Aegilops tauschii subsp. strangulata TaxID=200361 RepID=A0A453JSY4_AEGTS